MGTGDGGGPIVTGTAPPPPVRDAATAKRKFEATAELGKSAGPVALTPEQLAGPAKKERPGGATAGGPGTPKAPGADEGMSRLLKAKQKARDEMSDGETDKS